jgi:hypothetical protein
LVTGRPYEVLEVTGAGEDWVGATSVGATSVGATSEDEPDEEDRSLEDEPLDDEPLDDDWLEEADAFLTALACFGPSAGSEPAAICTASPPPITAAATTESAVSRTVITAVDARGRRWRGRRRGLTGGEYSGSPRSGKSSYA